MGVEPVPGEPAAVADCNGERALVVADYHAGIERGLRREGVELDSRADQRRGSVLTLVDRHAPDRVVFLGDLTDAIGDVRDGEREEATALLAAVTERVPVTLIKGNHDGGTEALSDAFDRVRLSSGRGARIGDVGFAHGHTWPGRDVLSGEVLCVGHEHPTVKLEDEVGGSRVERVWLRSTVDPEPFVDWYDSDIAVPDELIVFPAFNNLSGGTWINVEGQAFLSPFLPDALSDGQAYLLDGTRLGRYDAV